MATPEQIRERLEDMAKKHGPQVTNIAKVLSVDEDKGTCILIDEDNLEINNVRLRPVVNENKSKLEIPELGSYVAAVRVEDTEEWMVIACDKFQKVVYTVGTITFELSDKVKIECGGESLATLFDEFFDAIIQMSFVTPSGNTTALVNSAAFMQLKTRFQSLLK